MLDHRELNALVEHALRVAAERDDPLIFELAEELRTQEAALEVWNRALEEQGLPLGTTVERFVRHHRGNAATAAGLQFYSELLGQYTPGELEIREMARELYETDELSPGQLEKARKVLIKANSLRM